MAAKKKKASQKAAGAVTAGRKTNRRGPIRPPCSRPTGVKVKGTGKRGSTGAFCRRAPGNHKK